MAKPSKDISLSIGGTFLAQISKSAPCTIPKSDCGESPRAARLREPSDGSVQGGAGGGFIGGRSDALVERHHDVAADGFLRFDADLRTEHDCFPVEIALKDGAFFAHGARIRRARISGTRRNR